MSATAPSEWPLWGVVGTWPHGVDRELLNAPPFAAQARYIVRAPSRAAAARALTAVGVYHTPQYGSRHLAEYGSPSKNPLELSVAQDASVYVTSSNTHGSDSVYLALPVQKES